MYVIAAYAVSFVFFFAIIFIKAHLPTRPWIQRWRAKIRNRFVYSTVIGRYRFFGPWLTSHVMIFFIYVTINILCVTLRVDIRYGIFLASTPTAARRAGYLALINLMPLFASPYFPFMADTLGLSLRKVVFIHRICSFSSACLCIAHGIPVALHYDQSLNKLQLNMSIIILIYASFFVLYIIKQVAKIVFKTVLYEVYIKVHQALAIAFAYFIICHLKSQSIQKWPLYVFGSFIALLNAYYIAQSLYRNKKFGARWTFATIKKIGNISCVNIHLSRPISVEPGQYITIWLPGIQLLTAHSYAIAKVEQICNARCLEIVVMRQCGFSTKLWKLSDRSEEHWAFITGPHGRKIPAKFYSIITIVVSGLGVLPALLYIEKLLKSAQVHSIRLIWLKSSIDTYLAINRINTALVLDTHKKLKVLIYDPNGREECQGRAKVIVKIPDFKKALEDCSYFSDLSRSYFDDSDEIDTARYLLVVSAENDIRDKLRRIASISCKNVYLHELDFQPDFDNNGRSGAQGSAIAIKRLEQDSE